MLLLLIITSKSDRGRMSNLHQSPYYPSFFLVVLEEQIIGFVIAFKTLKQPDLQCICDPQIRVDTDGKHVCHKAKVKMKMNIFGLQQKLGFTFSLLPNSSFVECLLVDAVVFQKNRLILFWVLLKIY